MQMARMLGQEGYQVATVVGGYEAMKKFRKTISKSSECVTIEETEVLYKKENFGSYIEERKLMNTYELVVPCHFGLEAVTKREIYDLGYEITKVEDGRITFEGDAEAICRANIFLRSAERVLLQVGRFHATTFDELLRGLRPCLGKSIFQRTESSG